MALEREIGNTIVLLKNFYVFFFFLVFRMKWIEMKWNISSLSLTTAWCWWCWLWWQETSENCFPFLFSIAKILHVRSDGSREHSSNRAAMKHKTDDTKAKKRSGRRANRKKKRNLIEMALSRYARDALCRVSLNDTSEWRQHCERHKKSDTEKMIKELG